MHVCPHASTGWWEAHPPEVQHAWQGAALQRQGGGPQPQQPSSWLGVPSTGLGGC